MQGKTYNIPAPIEILLKALNYGAALSTEQMGIKGPFCQEMSWQDI